MSPIAQSLDTQQQDPSRSRIRIVAAPVYEPAPADAPSVVVTTTPAAVTTAHSGPRASPQPRVSRKPQRPVSVPASTVAAHRFAQATVTALFEILDHRRPLAHVGALVSASLLERVETLVGADLARTGAEGQTGAARVRRVHVQMCGPAAAEIFGTYSRGRRVRAFAGRIERVPCRVRDDAAGAGPAASRYRSTAFKTEYRWRLVVFELT
ncbi:Rv3235 family protein [Gordonia sp. NPDC003376]